MTILGILLGITPFGFLLLFADKKRGFFEILLFVLVGYTAIALFLQFFGIFSYGFVFGIHVLITITIAALLCWYRSRFIIPDFKKVNWTLIFVVVVSFLSLYFVHYSYTGKINTAVDRNYKNIENLSYTYPYFSDEWYSVAFIKNSFATGKLPLQNPFMQGHSFLNISAPFHGFLGEILMLTYSNPLSGYVPVGIIFNIMIIVLVYLFIRGDSQKQLAPAIGALSLLYIPDAGNFPVLWTLIPVTLGFFCLLLEFFFIQNKKVIQSVLALLLTLIFYPPLFILGALALVVWLLFNESGADISKRQSFIIGGGILVLGCMIFGSFLYFSSFQFLTSKIVHEATSAWLPFFSFFVLVPWWIIPFSFVGIVFLWKKMRWLSVTFSAVLIWWYFSSFTLTRFLFEYERIAYVGAILAVITGGIVLVSLYDFCEEKFPFVQKYLQGAALFILFLFFVGTFFYTQNENWQKLTALDTKTGYIFGPASPANEYLTEGDLQIFKNIHNANFLSVPWKGTVLGVATDNYPLSIKGGTISLNTDLYHVFQGANCVEKNTIVHEHDIGYVYGYPFVCPGFTSQAQSQEGLILYRVIH